MTQPAPARPIPATTPATRTQRTTASRLMTRSLDDRAARPMGSRAGRLGEKHLAEFGPLHLVAVGARSPGDIGDDAHVAGDLERGDAPLAVRDHLGLVQLDAGAG